MSTKSRCRPDRWPQNLSNEALLERLLVLNLERSSADKDAELQTARWDASSDDEHFARSVSR